MKLLLPVRDILVTQPFGVNYLDFYQQWGLKGHNGIDFYARRGCLVLAAHDGIVLLAGMDGDGGISVEIFNSDDRYKTIYYHLLRTGSKIHKGVKVSCGEIIGYANNTGKYTTGDHLHFGMKFTDEKGNTRDYNNGYHGAVDPSSYFINRYGKMWDRPAVYHRYGRKQVWLAEWKMRYKNSWVQRQLLKTYKRKIPLLNIEETNALVYGGWDFETVMNPAMYEIWAHLTKTLYQEGKRSFT